MIRFSSEDDAHDRVSDPPAMGMTRRDVDDLYKSSVRDVESYLSKESGREPATRSYAEYLLEALASLSGAAAGGYLSGRQQSIVPSVVLGAISHGVAYSNLFGYAEPLHTFGNGALDSAIAIWAAGRGALAAQHREATVPGAGTGAALHHASVQGPLSEEDLQAIAASRRHR